jgi:hypothetical protein
MSHPLSNLLVHLRRVALAPAKTGWRNGGELSLMPQKEIYKIFVYLACGEALL